LARKIVPAGVIIEDTDSRVVRRGRRAQDVLRSRRPTARRRRTRKLMAWITLLTGQRIVPRAVGGVTAGLIT